MKIVKLQAENIKRLRAVEITPDGNTVIIAGANGQGKTSVLDAIWFALGGGPATKGTSKPIRDGEDHASVTLDLGELRVTRTWRGAKTTLRVESADGASYSSPQSMLDSLVGRLSFDPLAFAQRDERTQLASLIELVELPFDPDEIAAERARLYEARTEIGRAGKQLEGQLAGMSKPADDLPAEEIDVAKVLADRRTAQEQVDEYRSAQRLVETVGQRIDSCESRIANLERELAETRTELANHESDLVNTKSEVAVLGQSLPDVDAFEAAAIAAQSTNADIRAAAQYRDLLSKQDGARTEYMALNKQISALDERKSAAIAAAEMPIDGLAFDEAGVTYRGMPFKQCSAAEQLRVSLAMAMAMNPQIRVIRITDGSLLDSRNMALIEEMAKAQDYQVWIERVDESGKIGIVIEDGAIVPATVPA